VSDSSTQTVHVALAKRSYDILIGSGNLPTLPDVIDEVSPTSHVVIVTDTEVEEPHAESVADALASEERRVDLLVVEAGEESKSIDTALALWEKMLELGTDRRSLVVAVGGGVVGDLGGFVAAGFARGVRFMQVPTTLLAQVDSSVGGKVGINLPQAKNMVGAFWQPAAVLIDTDTLATLPDRPYRAGLAEVVKYGVILDAEFFAFLEQNVDALNQRQAKTLRHAIKRSCELKADVVRQDEREESGLRAVLNYGHTFCHAFEALTGYGQLLHGEAVAIGMQCAARLAQRLGRIDETLVTRQGQLLTRLGLSTDVPQLDVEKIIDCMRHDKKAIDGRLRFILPDRLGHVEIVEDIDPTEIAAAIRG